MKKFLIAGAVVMFAGLAATVATAADHKSTKHAPAPSHATVMTPATAQKESGPKKHHAGKRHHARAHRVHRAK